MPSTSFAFKQFVINQDKCAMKVGTDAVLLGAWVFPNGSKQILDIGTGTGVVALMLAQKTDAHIDAIDIDENAFLQATQNVSESKFVNQVSVTHSSLQEYSKTTSKKYNLIVTNPPYFEQSLKSSDEQRSFARHADVLPFEELIEGVTKLLDPKGKFCLILPKQEAELFVTVAKQHNLFLTKLLRVRTKPEADTEKRHLMQFEFKENGYFESTLIIENAKHFDYTEEYKNLTEGGCENCGS